MRFINSILLMVLVKVLVLSCVEPYELRTIDYERAIVVEGRLTDQAEGHYVKLSYTQAIGAEEKAPIFGATVWVEDNDGIKIDFSETVPGHYESTGNIAGVAGRCYQLFFETSGGKQYQSNTQELIASPPIARIYDEYAEKANQRSGEIVKGIQFFVDTHDDTGKAQYYKYEWEETYEVYASYPSFYEFLPNPDTAVVRTEEVSPCYVTGQSTAITLGSTATLTDNHLTEMPVRYLTSETEHLLNTYSILVKQYVVGAEAYGYYRDILKNNHENGSLFDRQLGAVAGNIISVEDPDEMVLGFFEVSGVSEKRTFVKFDELDKRFPWPKPQYPCSNSDQLIRISALDSLGYYVNSKGYGIISAEYCLGERCGTGFSAMLAPRYCTDCRFRGPADKPDFWIY